MVFNRENAYRLFREGNKGISEMVEKSKQLKVLSRYDDIRNSIEAIAEKTFPRSSVRIHFFGSRMMGVANDDSDIDIFVEIDGGFHSRYGTTSDHSLHDHHFNLLADALENSGSWVVKKRLLDTTVPIIISDYKLRPRNIISRMNCDISLTNGIAVRNTELLAKLFEVRPSSLPHLHFARRWLEHLGIDFLKGYTVTLMFIFFLQSDNFMPPCTKLQEQVPKEIIDDYEVQINRPYENNPTSSTYVSYGEFFRFYSKFDFDQVMSTSEGKCYSQSEYKKMYPEFVMEGILIAGPLKRGYNCGYMSVDQKGKFVTFCKDTVEFFDAKSLWGTNCL